MSEQSKYKPINCDYYDHFEIHAMRKTWIRLDIKEDDERTYYTKIKTLQTKAKSEYATLLHGQIIRLDQVIEMIPVDLTGSRIGAILDKIEYNQWANHLIMKTLHGQEISEDIKSALSHIFNAMDIWNTRMGSQGYGYGIWQVHDLADCMTIAEAMYQSTTAVFNEHSIDDMIKYTNLSGDAHQSSVRDILLHIVNHGTYHRGQIIQSLQQDGLKTVSTDFIKYSRIRG